MTDQSQPPSPLVDIESQPEKWAVLRAHKSYFKGQQVFDSYGPQLTSVQLYLDYGFVDEENKNFVVELPVSVVQI